LAVMMAAMVLAAMVATTLARMVATLLIMVLVGISNDCGQWH